MGHHRADARSTRLALSAIERALSLNASCATAHYFAALMNAFANRPVAVAFHANRALRLSPFDPSDFEAHLALGMAAIGEAKYEEAVASFAKGVANQPATQPVSAISRHSAGACRTRGRSDKLAAARARSSNPASASAIFSEFGMARRSRRNSPKARACWDCRNKPEMVKRRAPSSVDRLESAQPPLIVACRQPRPRQRLDVNSPERLRRGLKDVNNRRPDNCCVGHDNRVTGISSAIIKPSADPLQHINDALSALWSSRRIGQPGSDGVRLRGLNFFECPPRPAPIVTVTEGGFDSPERPSSVAVSPARADESHPYAVSAIKPSRPGKDLARGALINRFVEGKRRRPRRKSWRMADQGHPGRHHGQSNR